MICCLFHSRTARVFCRIVLSIVIEISFFPVCVCVPSIQLFSVNVLLLIFIVFSLASIGTLQQSRIRRENLSFGSGMRRHCWCCGSRHIRPASTPTTKYPSSRRMRWKACYTLRRRVNHPVQPRQHSKASYLAERTTFRCKRCPKTKFHCPPRRNIAPCRWSRSTWPTIRNR